MKDMMLQERNCKILALCALLLSAAGTVGATAPKGVFSVGQGVYATLGDKNYSVGSKCFFTFEDVQAISVTEWHVLDKDEWTYLLVTRDAGRAPADQRNGIGTVNGIHGLIIIPDNGEDPKVLQRMVMEVNSTQVSAQDVLSDNIYRFSRNTHALEALYA